MTFEYALAGLVSAGLLFSKIVKPKKIRIHGPRNVN